METIQAATQRGTFIWADPSGHGRDIYVYFRKLVGVENLDRGAPAQLHLFADSAYRLYVNGQFAASGPARGNPDAPEFDTVDLAPWLAEGPNTITVAVNFFGTKTYNAISRQGGFIAWGEIPMAGGASVNLDTVPGSWECMTSRGHTRYATKMSFALNACEICEPHLDEGWLSGDFGDPRWLPAVELENQKAWGPLAPRSIPMLDYRPAPVAATLPLVPLANRDRVYSFSVPAPHFYTDQKADFDNTVLFKTWAYSPADQDVPVGAFWGENWINGEQASTVESPTTSLRNTQIWRLRQGWNFIFGKVGVYHDVLDHYFCLPEDSGILFSAEKSMGSSCRFLATRPTLKTTLGDALSRRQLPLPPEDDAADLGGWTAHGDEDCAQSPVRESLWDTYANPFETVTPASIAGKVFEAARYPKGFSLTLDLGYTRLVFPRLALSGVCGAVVDVTYSEYLAGDRLHFQGPHHYLPGDRLICRADRVEWSPLVPRGCRYVKLTVRHAGDDVRLDLFDFLSANYPVRGEGSLRSSDPVLNEIWAMGARTVATTREDAYNDCVTRERGMYIRDVVIQFQTDLAAFGDTALMRRCLDLYGGDPVPDTGLFRAVYPNTGAYTISDFCLNAVEGFRDYWRATGDLDFVKKHLPAILKNLAWFHELSEEREDGLLDSDWHIHRKVASYYGGYHGDNSAPKNEMAISGPDCGLTCFYAMAMEAAAELCSAAGDGKNERRLTRKLRAIRSSVRTLLWNSELGRFNDNLTAKTQSIQANTLAVLAGVPDRAQTIQLKRWIPSKLRCFFVNGRDPSGGVYFGASFGYYVFAALYRLGLVETAENLMRQGWGWFLSQGLQTTPEFFGIRVGHSLCHGWSSCPTSYLSKNLLGVRFPDPADPDSVEISPATATVDSCEGVWPHPKGPLHIRWHREGSKFVFDQITAPHGVRWTTCNGEKGPQ